MLRAVILFVAMLGATNHALAGLMPYEGAGAFEGGGTFTFMFDYDVAVLAPPSNATLTTEGGSFPDYTYTNVSGGAIGFNGFLTLLNFSGIGRQIRLDFSPPGLGPDVNAEVFAFERTIEITRTGVGTASAETVPAPATLALFGLGLAGLGWSRRKKA